jgi:Domain of unknown function (DUF4375)
MDAVRRCFSHKHADEQFYALAETLLWKNQKLSLLITNGPSDWINESQRVFATVAKLDLQVPNGGLMQFFWNCPEWVDDVPTSLRSIDMRELASVFERSTAELVAQIGTYSAFRKKDSLEAFSECASKFDFGEFDSAYFHYGDQVYAKSIAFVSEHLADYVIL